MEHHKSLLELLVERPAPSHAVDLAPKGIYPKAKL